MAFFKLKLSSAQSMRRRSFMAQPFRHSVSGIFYLRRKVPAELLAALGLEFKRSLRTTDPAVAKARFAVVWSESEQAFARARAELNGQSALSQHDIQQFAAQWFAEEVRRLERGKAFPSMLSERERGLTDGGDEYTIYDALGRSYDIEESELSGWAVDAATGALRARNVPMPIAGSAPDLQLRAAFRERLLELSEFALKRQKGDWLFKPDVWSHHTSEVRAAPPIQGKGTLKLLDLFDLYAKNKALTDGDTRATRKTVNDYRSIVRRFIELCGDLDLRNIDRQVIHAYRTKLADTPAKGKGIRSLSASQLVDKAVTENLPRLGEATIRNRLRAVSAVLSFAVKQGLVKENPVIASGLGRAAAKAATRKAARTRRVKDYSRDELLMIFTSPIYQPEGWTPPRADFGRAWYWLPLLMCYTGARREELAQLHVRDVCVSDDRIHYLDILSTNC